VAVRALIVNPLSAMNFLKSFNFSCFQACRANNGPAGVSARFRAPRRDAEGLHFFEYLFKRKLGE